MNAPARAMYRWLDPQGVVLAEVRQGLAMTPAGPRAAYYAVVPGQAPIAKERFTCAKKVIDQWVTLNRIHATVVPA